METSHSPKAKQKNSLLEIAKDDLEPEDGIFTIPSEDDNNKQFAVIRGVDGRNQPEQGRDKAVSLTNKYQAELLKAIDTFTAEITSEIKTAPHAESLVDKKLISLLDTLQGIGERNIRAGWELGNKGHLDVYSDMSLNERLDKNKQYLRDSYIPDLKAKVMAGIAEMNKPKQYGGDGSGNWGHEGRPGEVGGSGPGGLDMSGLKNRREITHQRVEVSKSKLREARGKIREKTDKLNKESKTGVSPSLEAIDEINQMEDRARLDFMTDHPSVDFDVTHEWSLIPEFAKAEYIKQPVPAGDYYHVANASYKGGDLFSFNQLKKQGGDVGEWKWDERKTGGGDVFLFDDALQAKEFQEIYGDEGDKILKVSLPPKNKGRRDIDEGYVKIRTRIPAEYISDADMQKQVVK